MLLHLVVIELEITAKTYWTGEGLRTRRVQWPGREPLDGTAAIFRNENLRIGARVCRVGMKRSRPGGCEMPLSAC